MDGTTKQPRPAQAALPPELAAFIRPGYTCVLSTLRKDGSVSSVPLCPMFDGTNLWLSSRADTLKVRNLERDGRATLLMVDPDNMQRYAQVRGRAELVADESRAMINALASFHMGVDVYPYDKPGQHRVSIIVHPESVSMPVVHGS